MRFAALVFLLVPLWASGFYQLPSQVGVAATRTNFDEKTTAVFADIASSTNSTYSIFASRTTSDTYDLRDWSLGFSSDPIEKFSHSFDVSSNSVESYFQQNQLIYTLSRNRERSDLNFLFGLQRVRLLAVDAVDDEYYTITDPTLGIRSSWYLGRWTLGLSWQRYFYTRSTRDFARSEAARVLTTDSLLLVQSLGLSNFGLQAAWGGESYQIYGEFAISRSVVGGAVTRNTTLGASYTLAKAYSLGLEAGRSVPRDDDYQTSSYTTLQFSYSF